MIGSLTGKPVKAGQDVMLVDVQGVGYEVSPSRLLKQKVDSHNSGNLRVVVHTEVKENSISLFGFVDDVEKEVFLLLKKVKGIGPKLALTAVSTAGAENILKALSTGEHHVLKSVPGIGDKSAKRIILELGEKVDTLAVQIESVPANTEFSDACLALEKLGFEKGRAEKAVKNVYIAGKSASDVLREALRVI